MKIKGICIQCEGQKDDCILVRRDGCLVLYCRGCVDHPADERWWDEELGVVIAEKMKPLFGEGS